jgi:hypothetical protein
VRVSQAGTSVARHRPAATHFDPQTRINPGSQMKQLLFLTICFLSFFVSSSAQTSDTFDMATFQAPDGWKKQNKDGVVFFSTSNQQKGTYALITLYGSGASSGNAKSDFEGDWQQFIVGQFEVKSNPQMEPAKNVDGWEIINGGDKFGRLLTSQNRTPETVTYRFTKHYFSGIDQWQLVLQADKQTERDGPFSTFTLFANAWYYSPISANNPLVELPR